MSTLVHTFTHDETQRLLDAAARAIWSDGRFSALGAAREVKRCQVADLKLEADVYPVVVQLQGCKLLRRVALPRRYTAWKLIRYRAGDYYGEHTDTTANGNGFRADFSLTVVLRAAEAGGEFRSFWPGEAPSFRPERAGQVYVYPSTTVHEVCPVEQGERIVLHAWIESFIRDAGQRSVIAALDEMADGDAERSSQNLQAVRNELLRYWT